MIDFLTADLGKVPIFIGKVPSPAVDIWARCLGKVPTSRERLESAVGRLTYQKLSYLPVWWEPLAN